MTEFEDRIQVLRLRFVERAAADAAAIQDHAESRHWPALRDLAHSIVGRAGMFGFSELSAVARTLEEAIDANGEADRLAHLSEALVSVLREVASAK